MTRGELLTKLWERYGEGAGDKIDEGFRMDKPLCVKVLDLLFDTIKETIVEGRRVDIRGFGSFHLRHRPMRSAHNPITREWIRVPAKKAPFFKSGKELKELLNR